VSVQERLEELMSVVLALVRFDYQTKATVSDANDLVDGLAYGLNMLGEELAATTVSKTYLDDVIASLKDPLVVVDRSGIVHTANHALVELSGWERDELIDQSIGLFLPDVPLERLLEASDLEAELSTRAGTKVSVSCSGSKMKAKASEHYVCILRDLTALKQAEAERWRMREALARQAILVEELSTPLIPLTEDLLVMPLVGTLDSARMAQVTETLLEGIVATKSKTAILDVTGVRTFDAEAVDEIMRCVGSVRLVGARAMLTGVNAKTAATLARLGVDLGEVEAHATLRHAIASALDLKARARATAEATRSPRARK
jgi:rsbT co-antagonist protein RsbR